MHQFIWRVAALVATLAIVAAASGAGEAGSSGGQARSGGGQTGPHTTANKNQPKPKMTIKFSPEYTRMQGKSGSSSK
jgi:hypothetical protein